MRARRTRLADQAKHAGARLDLEDPLGGSDRDALARIDRAAQALLNGQRVAGKRVLNQRQETDSPYANPWGYVRLGA